MKKITIIGTNIEDSFEFHLYNTVLKMGYLCELIDPFYGTGILREAIRKINYFDALPLFHWDIIFKRITNINPDLVIVAYRDFHPLLVKKIKAQGIKIIHINPDTITTLNRQAIFSEPYDYYFVKSDFMLNFMTKKLGLNTYRYSEAYNQSHLVSSYNSKLEAEDEEKIDVLMYGGYYPAKTRMASELSKQGINLQLYGSKGFYFPKELEPNFNDLYLKGEQKANKIFGSKVVYNNLLFAEIDSLNCRFFETIGAAGVPITDNVLELRKIYNTDYIKYISYDNLSEVKDKITFLLNENNLRLEISDYNKSLSKEYTYEKMLGRIFKIINT
jgi:spore maturation protein CgeB